MSKIFSAKEYMKHRLGYDWWKYLIVVVLVCVLCYYAFYLADRLKPTEKIQIFTSAEITDFSIEKELEDTFADKGIYDYFFYQASFDNKYFDIALESQGFENSDILIVPEEALTAEILAMCAEFDSEFIDECTLANEGIRFVQNEGKTYGVKIYAKDDDQYNDRFSFLSWLNPDRDYCMVFSKKSKNVGRLSSESDDNNRCALDTYIYLLGRK